MGIRRDVIEYYKKEAEIYDEARFTTEFGKYVHAVQKEIISKMCDFEDNGIVLDVGTGTGRFAIELAKNREWEIVALDSSKNMVKKVRKKAYCENMHDKINTVVADANNLPFKRASFSGCISINTLNHIPDYDSTLIEIARVLMKTGCAIMNFPHIQSIYLPVALLVQIRRRALFKSVYSRWFTQKELMKSFLKAGLEIIDIEKCFMPLLFSLPKRFLPFIEKLRKHFPFRLKFFSGTLFIKSAKLR